MPDLSATERAILEVLVDGPLSVDDGFDLLLPPRPSWLRMGGRRAYSVRWMATMRAWVAMEKAGMLTAARDGWQMYAITDAGREALGEARKEAV